MKKTTIEKIYKVKVINKTNRESIYEGTLESLIIVFSYTLEVGYSLNKKINKQPKTIKSFITNLKNSYLIKEASCYNRTFIELITV
jgi:hypothetical protein